MNEKLSDRQRQIAESAAAVFLAKGYARTTMGDIALAGRISRQGLYLLFPGKEPIFTAAVRLLNDRLIGEIVGALPRHERIEDKLVFACEGWLASVYDLQQSTPDARDMDDLSFPVVREVYDRFVDLIADVLQGAPGVDASAIAPLARLLVFAIRGFSATAADGADMRRLAALQVKIVVAAIAAGADG